MTRLTALALFLSSIAAAQSVTPADANDTTTDDIYEEVVVTGMNSCGQWPFPHYGLDGCTYLELIRKDIGMVRDLRRQFLGTCLTCDGNRCTPNKWSRNQLQERMICKRLFLTPENVTTLLFRIRHSTALEASVTFSISTTGDVEDISLLSYEADFAEEELLELIKSGARRASFLPLEVDGTAYEITGLQSTWIVVEGETGE